MIESMVFIKKQIVMREKNFKKDLLLLLLCLFFGRVNAQELYVGDEGSFYLSTSASSNFATSNTPISHHENGVFAVEAGSNWTTATEYVNGELTVVGAGTTIANIGGGDQSTVTITTLVEDIAKCKYTIGMPPAGSMDNLGNYVLSDDEYWTVTNMGPSIDLLVSDLTEKSGATYGGVESQGEQTVIVRLDGTDWKFYSESTGTGQFALAVDVTVLGVGDENYLIDSVSVYPNPVKANVTSIYFSLPKDVQQLDVILYDVTGKVVRQYKNKLVKTGVNNISKPSVAKGLYFLKFSINNGEQQVTKKIVIE